MAGSEVARIRQQIELECEAMERGFRGFAITARHDFINHRLSQIAACQRRVTTVGGWVELVEAGNVFLNAGPATQQFLDWWNAFSLSKGIDARVVEHLGLMLEQAGWQGIQTRTLELPVGAWGNADQRRIGNLLALDMLTGFPGIKQPCCDLLKLAPAEFDAVMQELPREWARLQTRYQFYAAWGQRW